MYERIDFLQESDDYYFIDYIPYHPTDREFLELEEYFQQTYLPEFAEKIIRIILKVVYFYPCQIFLTEPSKAIPEQQDFSFDTDIRNTKPEQIAHAIRQVILKDFSSVQILFSKPEFLVSIDGEFSVTVYVPPQDAIELFQQLTDHEGLYFKKHRPDS